MNERAVVKTPEDRCRRLAWQHHASSANRRIKCSGFSPTVPSGGELRQGQSQAFDQAGIDLTCPNLLLRILWLKFNWRRQLGRAWRQSELGVVGINETNSRSISPPAINTKLGSMRGVAFGQERRNASLAEFLSVICSHYANLASSFNGAP